MHAQNIANLFVDEARLSGNEFPYIQLETEALEQISEKDPLQVSLPLIQSREHTVRSELYLF